MQLKSILIPLVLSSTILLSEGLNYDNIDTNDKAGTQKKIDQTYRYGFDIVKNFLIDYKNENKLSQRELIEECNDSLYDSIFTYTILDKANHDYAMKTFLADCESYATSMYN